MLKQYDRKNRGEVRWEQKRWRVTQPQGNRKKKIYFFTAAKGFLEGNRG